MHFARIARDVLLVPQCQSGCMPSPQRWALLTAVPLLIGLVSGCGSSGPPKPAVVAAKGKIAVDGTPLVGAKLFFVPEGTGAKDAAAASDASGNFELVTEGIPGAVPGRYKVLVQYYVKPDGSPFALAQSDADAGMDLDQFVAMGQAKLGIPKRYSTRETTDLQVEIPAIGTEAIDLALAKK